MAERRVLCATLHVDVSNAAALGLYRKAGFEEVRPGQPPLLLAASWRDGVSVGGLGSGGSVGGVGSQQVPAAMPLVALWVPVVLLGQLHTADMGCAAGLGWLMRGTGSDMYMLLFQLSCCVVRPNALRCWSGDFGRGLKLVCVCMCLVCVQDGLIEDYYGHGRHAHKLIVDLQESAAMQAFLAT